MAALDLNTLLFLLFVLKSWSVSTTLEPRSGSSPGLSSSVDDANYLPKRISHDLGKNETYSTKNRWKRLKSEVRPAGRIVESDLRRAMWSELYTEAGGGYPPSLPISFIS